MAQTTAALIDQSLAIVDEVGAAQAASDEDSAYVLKALLSLLAELSVREVLELYVNSDDLQQDDIPDEYFNALADLLAIDISPKYRGVRVADQEREGAINRLRRLTAIGPSYETQKACYF